MTDNIHVLILSICHMCTYSTCVIVLSTLDTFSFVIDNLLHSVVSS